MDKKYFESKHFEISLSKLEKYVFSVLPRTSLDYNLSKEEWLAMRSLAEDHNITIKLADKGSCVVVWNQEDVLAEADRQLQGNEIYESSGFKDADLVKLGEKSSNTFESLKKGNSLLKNLSISLINVRRPPILGKYN